jgi:hypothetical protein
MPCEVLWAPPEDETVQREEEDVEAWAGEEEWYGEEVASRQETTGEGVLDVVLIVVVVRRGRDEERGRERRRDGVQRTSRCEMVEVEAVNGPTVRDASEVGK